MPLSCNNIWVFHASYPSLSPACHRSDWNATNSALWLSGWAKLARHCGDVCLSESKWLWGLETATPLLPPLREAQLHVVRVVLGPLRVGDRTWLLAAPVSPDFSVAQEWTQGASLRGLCHLSPWSFFLFFFGKMRCMLIAACFPIRLPLLSCTCFLFPFPSLTFNFPALFWGLFVFKGFAWLIGIRAKGAGSAWAVLPGVKRNGLLWRLLRIFGLITFLLIFSLVSNHQRAPKGLSWCRVSSSLSLGASVWNRIDLKTFSEGSLVNGAGCKFTSRECHLLKQLLGRKGCGIAGESESAKLPLNVPLVSRRCQVESGGCGLRKLDACRMPQKGQVSFGVKQSSFRSFLFFCVPQCFLFYVLFWGPFFLVVVFCFV